MGAGLFVRSLWNVYRLQLGIEPEQGAHGGVRLADHRHRSDEGKQRQRRRQDVFYDEALARVRTLPGVERAGVVVGTPFQSSASTDLRLPGRDSIPQLAGGGPYIRAVSDGYFATAGTRMLRGRDFTAADVSSAARVAIVNETMARTLWPNADPIGECLLIDTLPCSSVVGVVEDARRFSLREKPAMQYYIPLGEEHAIGFGGRRMFVRPRGDASALRETLRAEMLRLNPGSRS